MTLRGLSKATRKDKHDRPADGFGQSTPYFSNLFVVGRTTIPNARDIKRRETRNYLLATAGNKKIVLWSLDPYTGDISGHRVVCEARGSLVRDVTALAFSEDGETLRCTTSTGDFVGVDLRSKQVNITCLSTW